MYLSKISHTNYMVKSLFHVQVYPKSTNVKYLTHSVSFVDCYEIEIILMHLSKLANTYCLLKSLFNESLLNHI